MTIAEIACNSNVPLKHMYKTKEQKLNLKWKLKNRVNIFYFFYDIHTVVSGITSNYMFFFHEKNFR